MDMQTAFDRFDWNRWLTTIPGIPSDWGKAAQPARRDRPASLARRRPVSPTRH